MTETRYKRFLVQKDCPECGYRHLSDHDHVQEHSLLEDGEGVSPSESPPQQESTPSPVSPVGAERGQLPGQAAEQIRQVREGKGRGKRKAAAEPTPEEMAQLRQAIELRARTLVQLECASFKAMLNVNVSDDMQKLLIMAWSDFAEAWGINFAGKIFSTLMLAGVHAAILKPVLLPEKKEEKKE